MEQTTKRIFENNLNLYIQFFKVCTFWSIPKPYQIVNKKFFYKILQSWTQVDQVFAHHFPLIIKASRDKIPLNLAGLPKNIKWSSQSIGILRVVKYKGKRIFVLNDSMLKVKLNLVCKLTLLQYFHTILNTHSKSIHYSINQHDTESYLY